MRSITKFPSAVIAILALVFAVSTASVAKEHYSKFPNIKIKNFGQMDDRFYRGARPDEEDYKALAELGIKTIIDLTDNSREYEQPAVEAAGLRYINIPMVDKSYPSMAQVNEFLKVVDDPETGKFYVHCAGVIALEWSERCIASMSTNGTSIRFWLRWSSTNSTPVSVTASRKTS
jgi:protein tyrosine phosphatase (PTP) superfamily phosphohydrolase (DUF442 family)